MNDGFFAAFEKAGQKASGEVGPVLKYDYRVDDFVHFEHRGYTRYGKIVRVLPEENGMPYYSVRVDTKGFSEFLKISRACLNGIQSDARTIESDLAEDR
jgi:hypothetical protein